MQKHVAKKCARSGNHFAFDDLDPVLVMGCRTISTNSTISNGTVQGHGPESSGNTCLTEGGGELGQTQTPYKTLPQHLYVTEEEVTGPCLTPVSGHRMFTPAQHCTGQLQLQQEKGDAVKDQLKVRLSVILNFHFHVS